MGGEGETRFFFLILTVRENFQTLCVGNSRKERKIKVYVQSKVCRHWLEGGGGKVEGGRRQQRLSGMTRKNRWRLQRVKRKVLGSVRRQKRCLLLKRYQ